MVQLFTSFFAFLNFAALIKLPQKYPEAWKKSRFHVPDGLYYAICVLSLLGFIVVFWKSCLSMTPALAIANVVALLVMAAGSVLVVVDTLLPTVLYEDPDGWRRACERFDADWLAPIQKRLGKTVRELVVVAPTIYGRLQWTLAAGERWKFWKSGRSPQQVALALAGPQGKAS
ncbi:hypothetical protein SDC9_195775 [bioreactor metagenome]|uniref:Uncharacterized protein n=1 Tax=bioreactor metagenome TaxID=1076179 RepID=A0A645IAM4_9ZZZZ